MAKKKNKKLTQKMKTKWSRPRLTVLDENTYSENQVIYAAYGGGGSGVHLTSFSRNSVYLLCDR